MVATGVSQLIRDFKPFNLQDRLNDVQGIDRVISSAIHAALRRHMLLGESVAVADESSPGGVKILSPEEIRQALDGLPDGGES